MINRHGQKNVVKLVVMHVRVCRFWGVYVRVHVVGAVVDVYACVSCTFRLECRRENDVRCPLRPHVSSSIFCFLL